MIAKTLCLGMLLWTPAYAATVVLSCPANTVPRPHDVLAVPILIDVGNATLGAYSVDLLYNPRDFDVTTVVPGPDPIFLGGFTISNIIMPGELEVAGYQTVLDMPRGQVAIATVTFTARRRRPFDVLVDTETLWTPLGDPIPIDAVVGCDPVWHRP